MLGAIIGDIVGSRFERYNHKSKDFVFFDDRCQLTDDSIMTLAVAKAIMETEKKINPTISEFEFGIEYDALLSQLTVKYMQELGRRYPNSGYGGKFIEWIFSEDPKPYGSFGNGSAMRISPAGFAARTEAEAIRLSQVITEVSHNSEEGIRGAEAVAVAIFMANHGYLKSEIRNRLALNYYPLDFTIDEIRPNYRFSATCQESVPQAIECFLEANSFEDTIRTAISLGGDSDTIAAIAGSMAEAYYGIPEDIRESALDYIDAELRLIVDEWEAFIGKDTERFKVLTKYINSGIADATSEVVMDSPVDKWLSEDEEDVSPNEQVDLVNDFVQEVNQFINAHPEYKRTSGQAVIKEDDGKLDQSELLLRNPKELEAKKNLELILEVTGTEPFNENNLLEFFRDDTIIKSLRRLKEIDQPSSKKLKAVYLEIGKVEATMAYKILVEADQATLFKYRVLDEASQAKPYLVLDPDTLSADWSEIHTECWRSDYPDQAWPPVYSGEQWLLFIQYEGMRGEKYKGDNNYPENWDKLLDLFRIQK